MFSSDSDILSYEPFAFHELAFLAQTKLHVDDAIVTGNTVTRQAGGLGVVSAGDVALIGQGAYGIAEGMDDQTLTLAAAPARVEGGTVIVRTFSPQRARAHAELLRRLTTGGSPREESHVLSRQAALEIETLGTLAEAYAAAVRGGGDNGDLREKAHRYESRFQAALNRAAIELDTNADGVAEEVIRLGVGRLMRE